MPVRVQSHDHDTITVSPGPDLVVQRGVVVPIGCPAPHGFTLYWMQVLTPPNAMGRNAVLRRNPNAGGNFNRRGWRVNVSLAAKMRRVGAPHFIDSRTANISMDGVFLESAANLSVGDLIDLRLTLPDASTCELSARVCRLAPVILAQGPFFSTDQPISAAGLSFLQMPPETRSILTCFLWRTIRETRGTGIHLHHD